MELVGWPQCRHYAPRAIERVVLHALPPHVVGETVHLRPHVESEAISLRKHDASRTCIDHHGKMCVQPEVESDDRERVVVYQRGLRETSSAADKSARNYSPPTKISPSAPRRARASISSSALHLMNISICIPTFNRAAHLENCLRSIAASASRSPVELQVCVSDNCSTDATEQVVHAAQGYLAIKYQRTATNVGMARNFLNVVAMADGDFVWMIGDDDLLMPDALGTLSSLIADHPRVDYFFVNANHLTTQYVLSFPQPFDTANLPATMEPCSPRGDSGALKFMELVDPHVSFDFLLGIFLSVFRREMWNANTHVLDPAALSDPRTFSHFDNTGPHVKIFAHAFANSNAFFFATPLSVCLTGAREWAPMYAMVRSVRFAELLGVYRANGLSFIRYLRCRNFALRTFLPDLTYMYLTSPRSGFDYVSPSKLILGNCLYPNFYLSALYYVGRKLKEIVMGRRA